MNKEQKERFEKLINKQEEEIYITLSDKILKELNIIESIFKAQLFEKSEKIYALPYLFDYDGYSGINGKYFCWIDVFSNIELLSLQKYKEELRIRYENTDNHSLMQNELIEIREKALKILNYYKENLSDKSKIVREFRENLKNLDSLQKEIEFTKKHHALIEIQNYDIFYIRIECDRTHHSPTIIRQDFEYNYSSNNIPLFLFCQNLIDFIDKFEFQKAKKETLKSICNEIELNEIRKILINEKIISKIDETDFLHHFTGQAMDESINKIKFIKIYRKDPNKSILFTLISELMNKKSVISLSQKINYSIRDNKNNMIKLDKNNNRFSLISNDFKKLCDQAKKRLNP